MKVPVSVYMEMTPNPAVMKFVANKYMITSDDQVEFSSAKEAMGYSDLAVALFNFPFVKKVFIAGNFVSITKTDAMEWDLVNMELREFLKEFIEEGNVAVVKIPEKKDLQTSESTEGKAINKRDFKPSEYDETIKSLLEEYVKPAVETDGGAIDFLAFEDGVVTVELRGACAGCPSSTATLKNGIENLLKQHLPEVKEVVAENETL